MRSVLSLAAAATIGLAGSIAQSASVDLTDGTFGVVGVDSDTITETSAGVTFTLQSTDNLVGAPRWIGLPGGDLLNGLQVGGGGGSTIEFTFTVDQDVTLTGYGTNQSAGFALGAPIFDVLDGATVLLDDALINDPTSTNISNSAGENDIVVSGLSIALIAGTSYTFDINDGGAAVQGFFTSFEFDVNSAAIPVPAALPLAATGFALLGWMGWRRRA